MYLLGSVNVCYVLLFAAEHQTEDGVPEKGREADDEISAACSC